MSSAELREDSAAATFSFSASEDLAAEPPYDLLLFVVAPLDFKEPLDFSLLSLKGFFLALLVAPRPRWLFIDSTDEDLWGGFKDGLIIQIVQ